MPNKENSIRIKYPPWSAKPSETEIVRFLVKHEVTGDDVTAVYPDIRAKCFYVRFASSEKAREFTDKTAVDSVFEYSNKVTTNVVVCDANEDVKYIRIFEVAPEITDDEIRDSLKDYGTIKHIVWEKSRPLPGFEIYNGVRGVQLLMQQEVPDLIDIGGEKKRVYYQGMTERCFRCNQAGHKRFECPKAPQTRLKNDGKGAKFDQHSDFPMINQSPAKITPKNATSTDGKILGENVMSVQEIIAKGLKYQSNVQLVQQQQLLHPASQTTPPTLPALPSNSSVTPVPNDTMIVDEQTHSNGTGAPVVQNTTEVETVVNGDKVSTHNSRSREKKNDAIVDLAKQQREKARDRSKLNKRDGSNVADHTRNRSRSNSRSGEAS